MNQDTFAALGTARSKMTFYQSIKLHERQYVSVIIVTTLIILVPFVLLVFWKWSKGLIYIYKKYLDKNASIICPMENVA